MSFMNHIGCIASLIRSTLLLVMDQDAMVANIGEGGLGDMDADGVCDEQSDHPGLGELAVGDDSVLGRYHPDKVCNISKRRLCHHSRQSLTSQHSRRPSCSRPLPIQKCA